MYNEQTESASVERPVFTTIKRIHEVLEKINNATGHIQRQEVMENSKLAEVPRVGSPLEEELKTVLSHAQEILNRIN